MHLSYGLLFAASIAQPLLGSPAPGSASVGTYDSAGYFLPMNGTASTTQFAVGTEFSGGTSCGMDALPSGSPGSNPGQGPGYLYAAINQLAFGANPGAGTGGPGGACGLCFQITPVSASGQVLNAQATTFMIIDECPISEPNTPNCGQCTKDSVNSFGQSFHFDIASDAMNSDQYNNFYAGVTDGSDWNNVYFSQVSCSPSTNVKPPLKSWGCVEGCHNNEAKNVCASS